GVVISPPTRPTCPTRLFSAACRRRARGDTRLPAAARCGARSCRPARRSSSASLPAARRRSARRAFPAAPHPPTRTLRRRGSPAAAPRIRPRTVLRHLRTTERDAAWRRDRPSSRPARQDRGVLTTLAWSDDVSEVERFHLQVLLDPEVRAFAPEACLLD